MSIIIFIAGGLPALLLVIAGLLVKFKKIHYIIAGYTDICEEKKKNIDMDKIGGFIAIFCFALAAIILIGAILIAAGFVLVALILYVLIIPIVIMALIYLQRYDLNNKDTEGKLKMKSKIILVSVAAVMVLITGTMGVIYFRSSSAAHFICENNILSISGMYGEKIKIKDIEELSIKDYIPEIKSRIDAVSVNTMRKGTFELVGLGTVKLFVDAQIKPFIYIKTKNELVVINETDSISTKELYEKLQKVLEEK